MLTRYTLKTGPFRIVAARLSPDHARTLRGVAARSGVPLSHIIAGLVADWIEQGATVNETVNPPQADFNALGAVAAQGAVLIPAKHERRQETGKSLPTKALMRIDQTRQEQRDAEKVRD